MEQSQPSSLTFEPNPFEQSFASKAREGSDNKENGSTLKNSAKLLKTELGDSDYNHSGTQFTGDDPNSGHRREAPGIGNVLTPLPLSAGGSAGIYPNGMNLLGVTSPMHWIGPRSDQFTPSGLESIMQQPHQHHQHQQQQMYRANGIPRQVPGSNLPLESPGILMSMPIQSGMIPTMPPVVSPLPISQQQYVAQSLPHSIAPNIPPVNKDSIHSDANSLQVSDPLDHKKASQNPPLKRQIEQNEKATPDRKDDSDESVAKCRKVLDEQREQFEEEKRKQSLERNRKAAVRCRQRKKIYVDELKQKVDAFSRLNNDLQRKVITLEHDLKQLQQFVVGVHDLRALPPNIAGIVNFNPNNIQGQQQQSESAVVANAPMQQQQPLKGEKQEIIDSTIHLDAPYEGYNMQQIPS